MTNNEKTEELCRQAEQQVERLAALTKPFYAGRTCPLKSGADDRSCDGPRCMAFTVVAEDPNAPQKITNGGCVALMAFGQLAELNGSLQRTGMALENLAAASGPRILRPTT